MRNGRISFGLRNSLIIASKFRKLCIDNLYSGRLWAFMLRSCRDLGGCYEGYAMNFGTGRGIIVKEWRRYHLTPALLYITGEHAEEDVRASAKWRHALPPNGIKCLTDGLSDIP